MMEHTFNPTIQAAKANGCELRAQPGPQSKFQDSQGSVEGPWCKANQNQNKQHKHTGTQKAPRRQ